MTTPQQLQENISEFLETYERMKDLKEADLLQKGDY
jgi:hypothetical protein